LKKYKIIMMVAISIAFFATGILLSGYLLPHSIQVRLSSAADLFGYAASCLALAAAWIGWFYRFELLKEFGKRYFVNTGRPLAVQADRIQAMVIPVSNAILAEWILFSLRPHSVAFVYTETTRHIALNLATDFSEVGIRFFPTAANIRESEFVLSTPDDPRKARELVRLFIDHFLAAGIPAGNIFVDTTGGKVPMSIGAFQAAEEANISSTYIVASKGKIENPRSPEEGSAIFMSDHTH